jgi:hypothetical protein
MGVTLVLHTLSLRWFLPLNKTRLWKRAPRLAKQTAILIIIMSIFHRARLQAEDNTEIALPILWMLFLQGSSPVLSYCAKELRKLDAIREIHCNCEIPPNSLS